MKKITRWSPDTCECVLEYEWDTNDPPETRQHIFSATVKKCSAHSGIVQGANLYDNVLKENKAKNKVLSEFINSLPRFTKKVPDGNGQDVTQLADNVKYEWSFTGTNENRELQVNFVGANLSPQERQNLATLSLEKPITIL